MVRIVLVPAFVGAFIEQAYTLAFCLFVIAGITDGLDGYLARTLRQRSRFGALIDPLADKLLVLTAFFCLAYLDWIPLWLFALVIGRELLIVCGFLILRMARGDVHSKIVATWDSKLNTLAQMLLILVVMAAQVLDVPVLFTFGEGLVYVVGGLALFSGGHYIVLGLRVLLSRDK